MKSIQHVLRAGLLGAALIAIPFASPAQAQQTVEAYETINLEKAKQLVRSVGLDVEDVDVPGGKLHLVTVTLDNNQRVSILAMSLYNCTDEADYENSGCTILRFGSADYLQNF
jgi:hypothetical protein